MTGSWILSVQGSNSVHEKMSKIVDLNIIDFDIK